MSKIRKSALLSGWRTAHVGEILKVRNGYAFKSTDYRPEGVPLIRQSDIRENRVDVRDAKRVDSRFLEELPNFIVREGDLLIGMSGSLGKIARYDEPEPALQNQRTGLLLLKPGFAPNFAKLVLKYVEQQIIAEGKGIAVQNVSAKEIEDCVFPLAPECDRNEIVAETEKQFTRLEAGVAGLRRVQTKLKRYRAAVLKAACEGKLVSTEAELARQEGRSYETGAQLLDRILTERRKKWNGKGKYKEPAQADTAKLSLLPDGWTWLRIDAIAFVTKLAGFEYTKYVKYAPDGDLAVIKAENAGRDGFKRTEFSRINSSTVSQLQRSSLEPGDLLMVFVGAGTGNVARVPDDQLYFLGPNIGMIRVRSSNVLPTYLEIFLRSPIGNLLALSFSKAVAQPSLSMGTIRMIPVAIPSLREQQRIVAEVERRLSVMDEVEAVVTANLQRASRLRQSILKGAFSGAICQ